MRYKITTAGQMVLELEKRLTETLCELEETRTQLDAIRDTLRKLEGISSDLDAAIMDVLLQAELMTDVTH